MQLTLVNEVWHMVACQQDQKGEPTEEQSASYRSSGEADVLADVDSEEDSIFDFDVLNPPAANMSDTKRNSSSPKTGTSSGSRAASAMKRASSGEKRASSVSPGAAKRAAADGRTGGSVLSPVTRVLARVTSEPLLLLFFLGHACSSVTLILMNKSIAIAFPYTFTTVALQNLGTLVGATLLHLAGLHALKLPPRHFLWRIVLNAAWLVAVLWASIAALQKVSVPLYVLARNTVPFLTAFLDRVFLGLKMSWRTIGGLVLTFIGTSIYTLADSELDSRGLFYAIANVVLVSTICVYESVTMKQIKSELSPIQLNFYRVLFSMPFLPPLLYYEWTTNNMGAAEVWAALEPKLFSVILSAFLAFSIGTSLSDTLRSFLLSLQSMCSATTIQLANISYKFVTTVISRFTHPTEVHLVGWVGYAICTAGLVQYSIAPAKTTPLALKNEPEDGEEGDGVRGGAAGSKKSDAATKRRSSGSSSNAATMKLGQTVVKRRERNSTPHVAKPAPGRECEDHPC
eukprot:g4737.t1